MLQPKIISGKPEENYMLLLAYETKEKKLFDVKPYIKGSWYGMLKDKHYFNNVRLSEDGKGIEWSEGQDIAPHELYNNSLLI